MNVTAIRVDFKNQSLIEYIFEKTKPLVLLVN